MMMMMIMMMTMIDDAMLISIISIRCAQGTEKGKQRLVLVLMCTCTNSITAV